MRNYKFRITGFRIAGTVEQLLRRNKKLVIKNVTCVPKTVADAMTKEALAAITDFVVITEKE